MATSAGHKKKARRVLRGQRAKLLGMSEQERLVYAVGLLICDDKGVIKKDDLMPAMENPEILAEAVELLVECGVAPGASEN